MHAFNDPFIAWWTFSLTSYLGNDFLVKSWVIAIFGDDVVKLLDHGNRFIASKAFAHADPDRLVLG